MRSYYICNMIKLLIIEDDIELIRNMSSYFDSFGYTCEKAKTFKNGLEKLKNRPYDCILLDLNLPGGNGLALLDHIKETQEKCGTIILSANSSIEDKIDGLDLGADDYLTKPFHLAELNARIRSVVRRKTFNNKTTIALNEIHIDIPAQAVKIHHHDMSLTKKEFELLLFLVNNKNKVVTKQTLSQHIWGEYMDYSASFDHIYAQLKNLRKKMLALGCKDYIKTVYGIGYKFLISSDA